ncbi:MAG: N-formylglutamate amidohydrolase [Candidatus Binatia bacterium]
MNGAPVTLAGAGGTAPLVLTCEHASVDVPPEYQHLGLSAAEINEHIGWDIGAAPVTQELSRVLGVPAVLSGASRLLVDCNRALTDPDLIPHVSCGVPIPGNAQIDPPERAVRLARFYEPYHAAVDAELARHPGAMLLSVHSFTPSLNGQVRAFDVGVLFDAFEWLAAMLADGISRTGFSVRMNEPYSGLAGLIFSARSHGRRHGVRYLELEINNRLVSNESDGRAVARRLAPAVAAVAEARNREGS